MSLTLALNPLHSKDSTSGDGQEIGLCKGRERERKGRKVMREMKGKRGRGWRERFGYEIERKGRKLKGRNEEEREKEISVLSYSTLIHPILFCLILSVE